MSPPPRRALGRSPHAGARRSGSVHGRLRLERAPDTAAPMAESGSWPPSFRIGTAELRLSKEDTTPGTCRLVPRRARAQAHASHLWSLPCWYARCSRSHDVSSARETNSPLARSDHSRRGDVTRMRLTCAADAALHEPADHGAPAGPVPSAARSRRDRAAHAPTGRPMGRRGMVVASASLGMEARPLGRPCPRRALRAVDHGARRSRNALLRERTMARPMGSGIARASACHGCAWRTLSGPEDTHGRPMIEALRAPRLTGFAPRARRGGDRLAT